MILKPVLRREFERTPLKKFKNDYEWNICVTTSMIFKGFPGDNVEIPDLFGSESIKN